jgi:NAD(P)-dependent dehydrogenase (short-subunit alcohol dehydrogenase family)
MKVYGKTKLAQLLFTKYLSEKVDANKITVNAMHPGVIPTNLISKNGILGTALTTVWKLIGTSPKDGAETIVYLANSESVENISGEYFVKCKSVELAPHAKDQVSAQMLWDKSAEMCTLSKELEL